MKRSRAPSRLLHPPKRQCTSERDSSADHCASASPIVERVKCVPAALKATAATPAENVVNGVRAPAAIMPRRKLGLGMRRRGLGVRAKPQEGSSGSSSDAATGQTVRSNPQAGTDSPSFPALPQEASAPGVAAGSSSLSPPRASSMSIGRKRKPGPLHKPKAMSSNASSGVEGDGSALNAPATKSKGLLPMSERMTQYQELQREVHVFEVFFCKRSNKKHKTYDEGRRFLLVLCCCALSLFFFECCVLV